MERHESDSTKYQETLKMGGLQERQQQKVGFRVEQPMLETE